jgi:hypothetical protein
MVSISWIIIWYLYRVNDFRRDYIKYIVLISICLLFISSKSFNPLAFEILPVQCHDNKYLNKLLDSLRIEESDDGKQLLNINKKNGKEISRDEGPYQHNSKYSIYDADIFNCGKRFDAYEEEIARNIARQKIIKNYKLSNNYFDALVMYNCGYNRWLIGAPYKSFKFAENIMRRLK